MPEYPNPQHFVRWETTWALYDDLQRRLHSLPNEREFIDRVVAKWDAIYNGPGPNDQIAIKLVQLARDLYRSERFPDALPPYSDYLPGTLEGARYRDELLALHHRIQWPEITIGFLQGVIHRCFAIYLSNLPTAAFIETDSVLAEVPVLDAVDARKIVQSLIYELVQEPIIDHCILEHVRDQISENIEAISSKPERPLVPRDFKGTPAELVHAYLRGTPFETIFDVALPVFLPQETRFAGHWIIAPSGKGKTTLLHSMFLDDMKRDCSIIVMDSKGDLINPIRNLKEIEQRLVVVDPDEDHPLALNPLDIPKSNIAHTISLLEYIFSSLLEAKMTSLQSNLFRYLLPAIVQTIPGATLMTFRDIVENGIDAYRENFKQLKPLDRQFFEKQFNQKTYTDTRHQLIWRLDYLMTNPLIRAMFQAPKTKLDIGRQMDDAKIILVNNSKELLSEEGAEFFGRFFIALILSAAQQRSSRPASDKLPCFVYIDECQNVVRRDDKIATILDECRSQKIGLILAHQRTDQITSANVLSALSNCAIRFANSDDEAKALAPKLRTTPEFLQSLKRGTFAAFVRDLTPSAIALTIPYNDLGKLPQLTSPDRRLLRERMWQQFSFAPELSPPAATETHKAPARATTQPAEPTSSEDVSTPAKSERSKPDPSTGIEVDVPRGAAQSTPTVLGDIEATEPSSDWKP